MNHGDLNFLNLLYDLDSEEVNLIDFNRCGIEPNYQDLVKLYFFTFKKAPRLIKQVLTKFIHNLHQ
ncbi:phosphotransferase [bacterium]|nr:phosphotransferase [bacterium]